MNADSLLAAVTWRVVCEGDETHAPVISDRAGDPQSFFALTNEPDDDVVGWGLTPRLAVLDLARKMQWPVRQILAPNEIPVPSGTPAPRAHLAQMFTPVFRLDTEADR